uniref:Uncharacterized protein n=1 Tax=Anguilla anguilla TaxID=7936 RepID=A0A0E9WCJ0_ANGAN
MHALLSGLQYLQNSSYRESSSVKIFYSFSPKKIFNGTVVCSLDKSNTQKF